MGGIVRHSDQHLAYGNGWAAHFFDLVWRIVFFLPHRGALEASSALGGGCDIIRRMAGFGGFVCFSCSFLLSCIRRSFYRRAPSIGRLALLFFGGYYYPMCISVRRVKLMHQVSRQTLLWLVPHRV